MTPYDDYYGVDETDPYGGEDQGEESDFGASGSMDEHEIQERIQEVKEYVEEGNFQIAMNALGTIPKGEVQTERLEESIRNRDRNEALGIISTLAQETGDPMMGHDEEYVF